MSYHYSNTPTAQQCAPLLERPIGSKETNQTCLRQARAFLRSLEVCGFISLVRTKVSLPTEINSSSPSAAYMRQ